MAEPDDDAPTNVTALYGVANLGLNHPVPAVIEMLERFLEQARKGEISGVMVAGVRPTRALFWDWECGTASANSLVSVASQLNWRVLRDTSEAHDGVDDEGPGDAG